MCSWPGCVRYAASSVCHRTRSGGSQWGVIAVGPKLASLLIVTLQEEARLSIRGIRRYLETVHRLKVSVGAIV